MVEQQPSKLKRFGTIAVDQRAGGVRLFGETDLQAVLEQVLYTTSRANIAEVWIGGRSIAGTEA